MSYMQSPTVTQRVSPVSGATVNVTQTNAPLVLILAPAGLLAALTVNMPAGSYDGQTFNMYTTATITLLTVATASGSIVGNALATLLGGGAARYVWSMGNTTWYRLS